MPDIEKSIYRTFRHFLNNMGLILSNQQSFIRLEQNHKFFRTLKQLDKTCERETMKIGVIYVANGQEMQKQLLKNDKGSPLYYEFVDGLGWPVDLATHRGFLGGLDSNLSTGSVAPYFANATTEVIFHVVTSMPSNEKDPQQIQKVCAKMFSKFNSFRNVMLEMILFISFGLSMTEIIVHGLLFLNSTLCIS